MTKQIAVTLEGHEGGIHIDTEGRVLTSADERPTWAEGYAFAQMRTRTEWYQQRLGYDLPIQIGSPISIDARDLDWIAFDAEGDEVEIECDGEYRMDTLAQLLNVDREDFEQSKNFAKALAQRDVEHSYETQPTAEATLDEVENKTFSDVAKAVNA